MVSKRRCWNLWFSLEDDGISSVGGGLGQPIPPTHGKLIPPPLLSNLFYIDITGKRGILADIWWADSLQTPIYQNFGSVSDCESQALLSRELLKFGIEGRDRITNLKEAWKRNKNELLLFSLEIRALRVRSLGFGLSGITGLRTWLPQKPNYWRICILTNKNPPKNIPKEHFQWSSV